MTVAMGFLCSDGAVLAADSQHTGRNKRYSAKVWHIGNGSSRIGIAGAGDSLLLRKAVEQLADKWQPRMSVRRAVQMADDILYPMYLKYLKTDRHARLSLLLAIRDSRSVAVYENQNGPAFARIGRASQCIGSEGAGFGLYLADWLYKDSAPMTFARTVAAHILKETGKHDPHVGGDSCILMFPANVREAPWPVPLEHVAALESELDYVRKVTREIIVRTGVPGKDVNRETADQRKNALDKAERAVRSIWLNAEPNEMTVTTEMLNALLSRHGIKQSKKKD